MARIECSCQAPAIRPNGSSVTQKGGSLVSFIRHNNPFGTRRDAKLMINHMDGAASGGKGQNVTRAQVRCLEGRGHGTDHCGERDDGRANVCRTPTRAPNCILGSSSNALVGPGSGEARLLSA